jgi:hypothetical protein
MFGDLFSQHEEDYQAGILYQGRRKFLVGTGENALEPPHDFKTKRQSRKTKFGNREKLAPINGLAQITEQQMAIQLAQVVSNSKQSFLNLRFQTENRTRKMKTTALKPLVINHFSSVLRVDWQEVYQAGCHMYVNKGTGEVSVECPWKSHITPKKKNSLFTPTSMLRATFVSPISTDIEDPQSRRSAARSALSMSGSTPLSQTPMSQPMSQTSMSTSLRTPPTRTDTEDSIPFDPDDLGTGSLVYSAYDRTELDDMLFLLDNAK